MANKHVVTTYESWGSRLTGSITSVLVGVTLAAVAFPVMWCNEGRAVTTARSLEEGAGVVVSVGADRVDPANDSTLVHLTGRAETTETLTDPDFGVSAAGIKLIRTVEMYQWREVKQTESRQKFGGGQESVTTYSYPRVWSQDAINSSNFRQSDSYRNPGDLPWPSRTFPAARVTLGAFILSARQVTQISQAGRLRVDRQTAATLPAGTAVKPVNGLYYRGKNPDTPEIGDVRITFDVVAPLTVSIVARQLGNTFEAYPTRAGNSILLLDEGSVGADLMFTAAARENRVLTWVLRAVGFILFFLGLLLVFRPISVVGAVVPLLGTLLGAGLAVFSFLFAAVLSLATVATAWLFYRPMLSLGLAATAVGVLALLRRFGRKSGPARGSSRR